MSFLNNDFMKAIYDINPYVLLAGVCASDGQIGIVAPTVILGGFVAALEVLAEQERNQPKPPKNTNTPEIL